VEEDDMKQEEDERKEESQTNGAVRAVSMPCVRSPSMDSDAYERKYAEDAGDEKEHAAGAEGVEDAEGEGEVMRNGGVAAADSAATHTRQINIKAVVKQGNFAGDGGSKQMEPEAFVEVIAKKKTEGVLDGVKRFVSDQDTSIAADMRTNHPDIVIGYDPGHWAKNVRNELKLIFTSKKDFVGMSFRCPRWVMRSLKVAEDNTRDVLDDDDRCARSRWDTANEWRMEFSITLVFVMWTVHASVNQ
jgi:hypothetical protein